MTLYYEDRSDTIESIRASGFAAMLGEESALCCDRSMSAAEPLPDVEEMSLNVDDAAVEFEIFPTDMPEGRWFDIPADRLDKLMLP